MMVRPFVWILFLFLLVTVACGDKAGKQKEQERSLPVLELKTVDKAVTRSYVADIQAVQNVEIRARVNGFLDNICVDEGKPVQKGACLFRLNDEGLKAELAKAKAALVQAQADAKTFSFQAGQIRLMVQKDVIAQSELDVAEAKLDAAKARIEEARSMVADAESRLSYTRINAPFTGVVDRLPLKPGSIIREGDLLTTLSDATNVYAYFNVSENEYLEYVRSHKNMGGHPDGMREVQLQLSDGTLYPYLGKVETLEGEFEGTTGSIAFRARFPNPNRLLKHGNTGRIRLSTELKGALLVPQKSVVEIQDKDFVFVLGQADTVTMRSFKPKMRLDNYYVVASGLKPGERIIYEGAQELREGMRVRPKIILLDSLVAKVP